MVPGTWEAQAGPAPRSASDADPANGGGTATAGGCRAGQGGLRLQAAGLAGAEGRRRASRGLVESLLAPVSCPTLRPPGPLTPRGPLCSVPPTRSSTDGLVLLHLRPALPAHCPPLHPPCPASEPAGLGAMGTAPPRAARHSLGLSPGTPAPFAPRSAPQCPQGGGAGDRGSGSRGSGSLRGQARTQGWWPLLSGGAAGGQPGAGWLPGGRSVGAADKARNGSSLMRRTRPMMTNLGETRDTAPPTGLGAPQAPVLAPRLLALRPLPTPHCRPPPPPVRGPSLQGRAPPGGLGCRAGPGGFSDSSRQRDRRGG